MEGSTSLIITRGRHSGTNQQGNIMLHLFLVMACVHVHVHVLCTCIIIIVGNYCC